MAGYLAVQLVGYAAGYDRRLPDDEASGADRWMIFNVAMVGIALAVADGIRSRRQLDRFLVALVGFSSVMAAVGILQFTRIVDLTQYIRIPGLSRNSALIGVGARGDGDFARVAGTANHYIEFGVVLSLVLPIAMHYAFFSPPGRTRIVRWLMVGLIGSSIPLSISRSAILTVALAMTLMAVVWPWRRRYNVLVTTIVATAAFHVVNRGVLGTIKALFTNVDNDPSIQNRLSDGAYVMELWAQRPWLGRGVGTVLPDRYILLDNQLYGSLLAGGVLGVAALIAFFAVPFFLGRSVRLRGADEETRHLGQALAVVMPAAFLASGTFDSFSFATFVGVVFIVVGAVGALWRVESISPRLPMQLRESGDQYVNTPLTADLKARLRRANSELKDKARRARGG